MKGGENVSVGEMLGFTKRLKRILTCKSSSVKRMLLANLMSDIEEAYGIVDSYNGQFEKENPFVMNLFRTVEDELLDA